VRPDPDHNEGIGLQWQERLVGLGLILAGVIGFGLVYLMWKFSPLLSPRAPGMPAFPILSPISCLVPVTAIGSCGLVLVGLRKLILAD
jgi:hypothetical protein